MPDLTPEGRAELRRLLVEATPEPWEHGNHWHIQGASHCQCRPEWGPAQVRRMDINGEMMKAHIHRLPEDQVWKHGINVMVDGDLRSVVNDTSEYGYMDDADAALIVALRNNAEALLDAADERDANAWDRDYYQGMIDGWAERAEKAEAERDQLRTENDDLATIAATLKAENDRLRAAIARVKTTADEYRQVGALSVHLNELDDALAGDSNGGDQS